MKAHPARLFAVLVTLAAFAAVGALACAPPLEPLPFQPAGKDVDGKDSAPDPSALGPYPVGVKTMVFSRPMRRARGGA